MKKIFGYLLLSASLLSLGVVNKTNKDFEETTLLDNEDYVTLNHVRKASENNDVLKSEMFSQVAYDEESESYFLRFATAVKGEINTIQYLRSVEGKGDVAPYSNVLYYGISANGETLYYDGTNKVASSDTSLRGDYYWTCYTIKFNKGSEFINKNISLTLKVNDVEIASKTTSVTDNFNKLTIEAESDYVERMTADGKALNTETYNGVTFVKDLMGANYANAYLKFAFTSSTAGEVSLSATLRQASYAREFKKYVSVEVNGVAYEHNREWIPADPNYTEGTTHNQLAFIDLDLGTININKGYNTIKFILNGEYNGAAISYPQCPDFDKITLTSVASMKEYTHRCESVCPICGKCQNLDCNDEIVCKEKCDCTLSTLEAESDSVTITQATEPKWGGVTKGLYSETNTGYIKVENENGGSKFTFNFSSTNETDVILYAYVTPKKFEDYGLNEQSYLFVNDEKITYTSEKAPKDETLKDNEWATYFVKIEVAKIHLVEGNNTITFETIGWHGLMMDKIELLGQTTIQEVK